MIHSGHACHYILLSYLCHQLNNVILVLSKMHHSITQVVQVCY